MSKEISPLKLEFLREYAARTNTTKSLEELDAMFVEAPEGFEPPEGAITINWDRFKPLDQNTPSAKSTGVNFAPQYHTQTDKRFFVFEKKLIPFERGYKFITEFDKKEDALAFCRLNEYVWWGVVVFRDGQAVQVATGTGKVHIEKPEEVIEIN